MNNYLIDFVDAVTAEQITLYFANNNCTVLKEFSNLNKVYLVQSAAVPPTTELVESVQEELMEQFEEAVESYKEDLASKVDDYLNYFTEEWYNDNQIAIESGLRSEITEEFISGLRNLFAEHYIDVPSEKVDLVEELSSKVEELESSLNEEIEHGIQIKKALIESSKKEIIHTVCEGLTATQVEKIKSLAESVEFSTEEEYKTKLETIRENYFPSGVKKADEQQLHEEIETDETKAVATDAFVAAVSKAITRTTVK